MKKVLFILLIFPICASAQVDSAAYERMNNAGKELTSFCNQHGTGMGIAVGGLILTGIGVSVSSKQTSSLVYIGGGISLVGWIMEMSSYGHIHNAAKYLRGDMIVIPINKKQRNKKR